MGEKVTPGTVVRRPPTTLLAVTSPALVTGISTRPDSPGSRNGSPSVLLTSFGAPGRGYACALASIAVSALPAPSTPKPVSLSRPGVSRSRAVDVSACRTWDGVIPGLPDITSAAIPAACGADADVPKNGENPSTEVLTPSAAAKSGFCRTTPPVELKFPGVGGTPFGRKNTRRGPSEVKRSDCCVVGYRFGKGP